MTAAPRRRISIVRLLVVVLVFAVLAAAAVVVVRWVSASAGKTSSPWFAGYVDVTATPTFAFESPASDLGKNVVLSFVVATPDDACTPSWGAAYSLDAASEQLDLDRRIARLQQDGGEIAVSFGGQANQELATVCTSTAELEAAYRSVIDRYDLTTIDLDVEGAGLDDPAATARRAEALADIQRTMRASGKDLAIWLTLPVTPSGLEEGGQEVVRDTLAGGVDLAGVNAMTMDYGASLPAGTSMLDGSEQALQSLHRQLDVLYRQQGTTLSAATLWGKIGVTPMIGQNDVSGEVFTLDAARQLDAFVLAQGIERVSMWSLNRDMTCGANYANLSVVSDACSGVDQGDVRFADLLGAGLTGAPRFSAGKVTTDEPEDPAQLQDDPATSPYAIWNSSAAYLQGTKIVWHHNVYQAKWWTRGDLPDDPVLNEWETPWQLVGPVLPGETPIPQPTLPAGTYPDWDGTAVYQKGDRILFGGTPYEAKWWTQGDSPAAASSSPDDSPWVPLTLEQIQQLLGSSAAPN